MTRAAHRFSHTIALPTPYDADRLFGFLASRAIPGVEAVWRDTGWRYARSLRLPAGPGSVLLRQDDAEVRVSGLLTDRSDREAAIAAAARVLGLTPAPAEVDAALARQPETKPLVAERPGLRVPGAADGYELVIRAIVGQQISVPAASTACGLITAEHGDALPPELRIDPRLTHLFPAAGTLVAADPAGLRMPRARGNAVVGVASAFADGTVDLDGKPPAVRRRLVELRGIGPWTAGYVTMRACADPDVLLDGDLIVRRSADALGLPGTARGLAACGERFAPYRSYLTMHLWAAYAAGPRP